MKLDKITSKNDEHYTPAYAIEPIIKYIPSQSRIWCPFDTEDSYFVKMFRDYGHSVIATHIENGQDFFDLSFDCDYIISNPPYSIKNEIFMRLFKLGIPFAMLVGVVGLFEGPRFRTFRDETFEIMYFNRRISYFKDYTNPKPILNPPFSSVYLTSRVLPQKIVFEKVNKKFVTYPEPAFQFSLFDGFTA